MHVDLTEENKTKYLQAASKLDTSVVDLVNAVLSTVDAIELNREVKLEFRPISVGTPTAKPKKRRISFKITL